MTGVCDDEQAIYGFRAARRRPKRSSGSPPRQAWFEQIQAGWEWEPHELEALKMAAGAAGKTRRKEESLEHMFAQRHGSLHRRPLCVLNSPAAGRVSQESRHSFRLARPDIPCAIPRRAIELGPRVVAGYPDAAGRGIA